MRTLQHIAGQGMIKILLPGFPENHLKIPAVVIAVAIDAVLIPGVGMQPFSGCDARVQRVVALEAFFRIDLFSGGMTLCAIGHAFQNSVFFIQLARR